VILQNLRKGVVGIGVGFALVVGQSDDAVIIEPDRLGCRPAGNPAGGRVKGLDNAARIHQNNSVGNGAEDHFGLVLLVLKATRQRRIVTGFCFFAPPYCHMSIYRRCPLDIL
jgi:hypothetical protein